MRKTYLYMHHDAGLFFLRDQALSPKELYCSYCDAFDTLLGCYDDERALAVKLRQLFEEGYDLIPCEEYLDIKDRYCPPELRLWELIQFKVGSPEYTAYATRLKNAESLYWTKDGSDDTDRA